MAFHSAGMDGIEALGIDGGEESEKLGMNIDVDPFGRSAKSADVAGMQFRPTIMVGLGGTGVECVRRAKKKILERVGPLPTTAYVYIDADEKSFMNDSTGELAPVEQSEQCFIGGTNLQPLLNHPEAHAWLLNQLPGKLASGHYEKAAKGDGCGQIRAVGRIALLTSMLNVKATLNNAITRVEQLATHLQTQLRIADNDASLAPSPCVYIVCSIAGGTGCGTFIDTALLARDRIGNQAKMVGIFVLPDAFDEKVQGDQSQLAFMRANAYAALMELQTLQDMRDDLLLETVINAGGETVKLPRGRQLFDLAYLIDYKNESNRRFSRTEDVYELVARLLLHETASPFRVNADSVERNCNTLRAVDKCPETGLPRNFSSFANTRLGFPIVRLTRFCTWATLRELLEGELLKTQVTPGKQAEEILAFLSTNDLDEQGTVDQVQNRLLQDPQRKSPINESTEGISRTFGGDKNPREFVGLIRQKMETFSTRSLPAAEAAVNQNLSYYFGQSGSQDRPMAQQLDDFVNTCLERFGGRGTASILDALIARVSALKSEMLTENLAWIDTDRKSQTEAMDHALASLSSISFLKAKVSQKDEKLKEQSIAAFQAVVREELRTIARTAAVRIYDALLSLAEQRRQAVASFCSVCENLSRVLNEELQKLSVEGRRETANFVVELDATERGFLEEYFKANRVPPSRIIKASRDAAGQQERYYVRLLAANGDALVREFARRAADLYSAKIKTLDVVRHIADQKESGRALSVKLQALFDMCQPFWNTRPPQTSLQYNQYLALGCKPAAAGAGGNAGFSPEIERWIRQFTRASRGSASASATMVATGAPYEIELVRYTHGARAWYLSDAQKWKEKYNEVERLKAFPLHAFKCLMPLPDLFPDRQKGARQAFALAMALGFVAKRGDYYYMNVLASTDRTGGYDIPMHTDWRTVFGPPDERVLPADTGCIEFLFNKKRRGRDTLLLAQGRIAAADKLGEDPQKVDLIQSAFAEYTKTVGSATLKAQFSGYTRYLEEYGDGAERLRQQLEAERDLIKEYLRNLE